MVVDLDGVALGLVEDVDHLFVAEKHLPRDEWTYGECMERRTIMSLTGLDNRPGFLSGCGEGQPGEGQPWWNTGYGE